MTEPAALSKPKPSRSRVYDFMTVRDYLNALHKRDMDDYAGWSRHGADELAVMRALAEQLAPAFGVDIEHYWPIGWAAYTDAEKDLRTRFDIL